MAKLQIRNAEEKDVDLILRLIRDLAEYERLRAECHATEDDLRRTLFGKRPYAEVRIAELGNAPAGFALFFHSYSTFMGAPSLYLEDLFVVPEARRHGVGQALLRCLAKLAVERGCRRFEWAVLDWNQPAIDFYRSLGAVPMGDWTTMRVTGAALARLAEAQE